MATTAEFLIYALGGGHGHARRGLLIQRLLTQAGRGSVVLLRPGSDAHFPGATGPRLYAESFTAPGLAALHRALPRRLVVDTFPGGWRGELSEATLARFERCFLLARYARDPPGRPEAYERILTPYPARGSEWEPQPAGAESTGYVIDASHVRAEPDRRRFAVLDPAGRCRGRTLALLGELARRAGLAFDYRRSLAAPLRCRKLLSIGAGYHTFYELLGQGLDLRFLPVRKRWDDQFRRAARFDLELSRLDSLLPWLAAPFRPVHADTRPDWPRLLRLLTE